MVLDSLIKTDWTLQDDSLKSNMLYADKLHVIEERNANSYIDAQFHQS